MGTSLISKSDQETRQLAATLAPLLAPGDTLVLTGEMGSGKTFFVQALLQPLSPPQTVQSPSFSLVNVYQTAAFPVYHVDFYRLNSEAELWAAGWEDYLDGHGLLLIEWGQQFPRALPLSYLEIEFIALEEQSRRLVITARGARAERLREEWLKCDG